MIKHLATLVLLLAASAAQAQVDNSDTWGHRERKAIALGAATMAKEDGNDTSAWKEGFAEPRHYDSLMYWTVFVVTGAELATCDDGRPFIIRAGEGVDL